MPLKVGSIDVIQISLRPCPEDPNYDNADSRTTTLPKGHSKGPGYASFQANTIFEKDVKISLRDGARIRADIFRPADSDEKVPALVAWSPYGKSGRGFFHLDLVPGRVGIPQSKLSKYEKFEAPDPAEWTARGYAIVNVDVRGSWDSEGGSLPWWGTQEGRDGYDVTEELAKMEWCNGSIAFVGNSWLGMAQWFIAAERPPHLKCIAPFEGASDVYRELVCRGGVPSKAFLRFVGSMLFGECNGTQEDVASMIEKYPSMNDYWADKRANVSNINVPIYALASFSTGLHTFGSFRGFTEAQSQHKWLRVHATQEWHDLYQKETNDELQKFLDRYTKGIDNGWEETPKVRVSIYRYNKEPILNHIVPDWPIPSTEYKTLYLRADGSLQHQLPSDSSADTTLSYQSDVPFLQMDDDDEELGFQHIFASSAYLVGSARAKLFMSTPPDSGHDDMDIWLQLRKVDRSGAVLQQLTIPAQDSPIPDSEVPVVNPLRYLGPSGALRASHRALSAPESTPEFPEHDYTRRDPILPGQIVELDIGLWQTGMAFEPGESLLLKVSGHPMTLAEFPPLRGAELSQNKGRHVLHFGPDTPSALVVPLIDI
ncbi:uncharacterized protein A1O9_08705 [Exophiala aquamarina CBS 119918]|uniref:Xaa-Pro dipeptidyl-peptidase C-terminal domain-containing protein n=1 Tax=Exophiala aquamarina CBS 119918 TaxID=1182545 RepID=A0A072P5Q3_9EURO|nr:uncharacterized protein A1O9_08705 [Exophiala aquamarina CBS 119918]KEF55052.1 hypothetical protein A1O9_08705 [Exophiala aquamarina CBS 119918]